MEDSPISDSKELEKLSNKIVEKLLYEEYNSSFTIGIIGPWGNGKSSLIKSVQTQISNFRKSNDRNDRIRAENIIEVRFSPFLNHNVDEILSDFFISLSSQLKKYNGNLSISILDYSDKLIKLYKKGELNQFFERQLLKDKTLPVFEHYKKIDVAIKRINKKIIVYVDDLDRLTATEIMEVFKLIRNTANFSRITFLVALDKSYVVRALKDTHKYMDKNFIDKFLQLEIFLPAAQSDDLKRTFISNLKKSQHFVDSVSLNKLEELEKLIFNDGLFERYIKNHRDVIKLTNQFLFENQFLKNEILYSEFLYFIYLKLKFPNIIQKLNDKDKDLIHLDEFEYYYSLTINEDSDDDKSSSLRLLNYMKDYESLDRDLLKDTLELLFPEHDRLSPKINPLSIQKPENFYKFTTLSYKQDMLLVSDMTELYDVAETELKLLIDSYTQKNKVDEIIERIKYGVYQDENVIKRSLLISFLIFEKRSTDSVVILELIKISMQNDNINHESIRDWLISEYLEKESYSLLNRADTIRMLYSTQRDSDFFGNKRKTVIDIGSSYFTKYLDSHKNKMWQINDFTVFKLYHILKLLLTKSPLNKRMNEFFQEADISVLCAQLIDSDSPKRYNISSVIDEMFGGVNTFSRIIKNHKQSNDANIVEFLKFFELIMITNRSCTIVYNFDALELRKYKGYSSKMLAHFENKKNSITQLFYEFHNKSAFYSLIASNIYRENTSHIDNQSFNYNNRYYLVMTLEEEFLGDGHNIVIEVLRDPLSEVYQTKNIDTINLRFNPQEIKGPVITQGSKSIVSLVSVQRV